MAKPGEILQKYWGYSSFRPLQREIIEQVLSKKDIIALLPTGGGKSICFQVPALVNPGICIVVSPLVALMTDQVNALKSKGIKAMALTGGIPFAEVDSMLDNCIYGNFKFLYLSPERLQQEIVQERIKQMQVNLIAVDEAHCISQWGHDFRPAYLNIALLRNLKPEVPFMGLTATATRPVIKDIITQLGMNDPAVLQKSFLRENLAYVVQEAEDKNYYVARLLKEHQDSSIIYVRSRKATIEIAEFLKRKNISAMPFHGGLSRKEKTERLEKWLQNESRVMVATSAFGMGIDKPDVRSVIHLNLPESLESYFQEAGRAGRDGKYSKAVVLTNESDIPLLKNQFLKTLPDVSFVKLVYRKLNSYFRIAYGEGQDEEFFFNFHEFCSKYELNTLQAYNTLLLLDRCSIISLSEQFQKKTRIQFLISGRQLSFYLEKNPKFDPVVKSILRTYGGLFENKIEVNLELISRKAATNQAGAIQILEQLKQENIVDLEHDQQDTRVTFLVPREDEQTINPLIPLIRLQIESKKRKINGVLDYINTRDICRSEQLLHYFGEKNTKPCGICSVCAATNSKPDREQMKRIYYKIVQLLEEKEHSSREIIEKTDFPEQHVIEMLQLLTEKEALMRTPTNKYKLKHL